MLENIIYNSFKHIENKIKFWFILFIKISLVIHIIPVDGYFSISPSLIAWVLCVLSMLHFAFNYVLLVIQSG